jgi:large subunit ribosomal protein L13
MKTYNLKGKDIVEKWHVVDAADQSLGRVATRIASLLRGKHRPDFTPYLDMRDFVVVVNAERVRISGNNKMRQKLYRHHTQYPGGLKEISLEKMLARHPTRVIEHAVRGMLPHNRLGAKLRRHLHVYVGPEHPHHAQTGGAPSKPKEAPVAKPVVEEAPVAEEPVEEAVESVAEVTAEPVVEEAENVIAEEPETAAEPEAEGVQATEEESSS